MMYYTKINKFLGDILGCNITGLIEEIVAYLNSRPETGVQIAVEVQREKLLQTIGTNKSVMRLLPTPTSDFVGILLDTNIRGLVDLVLAFLNGCQCPGAEIARRLQHELRRQRIAARQALRLRGFRRLM
jgi:hypothetical protein